MKKELEKLVEGPGLVEFRIRAEAVLRHARKISARCQAVLQALYEREEKATPKRSREPVGRTSLHERPTKPH
jgi:hypothetical protein